VLEDQAWTIMSEGRYFKHVNWLLLMRR